MKSSQVHLALDLVDLGIRHILLLVQIFENARELVCEVDELVDPIFILMFHPPGS
jgi:hypothetical protein